MVGCQFNFNPGSLLKQDKLEEAQKLLNLTSLLEKRTYTYFTLPNDGT